ncbi:hypothetical protein HHI36_023260 [Cryptolaemus montrouzieri]|uniref:Uncharacterized protein n=1 Tax=Cryptolaemus montrouzieri TaxID=559131 RepID=A0ABD2PGM0_9CUCU
MSSVCERCKGKCDMDRAIVCDSCSSAFQEKYSGVGGSEKRMMDLKKERTLFFFCSECRLGIKKVPLILRRFNDLEKEVRKLKEELLMLRESNENIIDIKEDVIEKIIRVGKKGTKSRPMKIVLSNSGIARTVLRNESKIMESYGRDIAVSPDQTVMQRTHLKRVLGKLEQREKDGEKDLHVKFVRGIPTIMKKT